MIERSTVPLPHVLTRILERHQLSWNNIGIHGEFQPQKESAKSRLNASWNIQIGHSHTVLIIKLAWFEGGRGVRKGNWYYTGTVGRRNGNEYLSHFCIIKSKQAYSKMVKSVVTKSPIISVQELNSTGSHRFLISDPYAEHEFLVSILQQSEQAVLTATDDCTDEDKSRETLQLARGLVEDILEHRCLEEVTR